MTTPRRTYGRTNPDEFGHQDWVVLTPDAQTGNVDLLWFATVAQTLRLVLGESPFYANYGIPQHQVIETQIPPDFYIARTQAQYSQYFASLIATRAPPLVPRANPNPPIYYVRAVAHSGAVLQAPVAT